MRANKAMFADVELAEFSMLADYLDSLTRLLGLAMHISMISSRLKKLDPRGYLDTNQNRRVQS